VVARTTAIDELIVDSLAQGCDRVLCLAAGLDARPYRLQLSESLVWIEADLPLLMEEKNARSRTKRPVVV
jgi:O-methyltransferase involved in polyketide biosynthesis